LIILELGKNTFTNSIWFVIIRLTDLSGQNIPLLLMFGGNMDSTLEKIKEIISEPISKLDLVVDSIEYVKNGKYNFLNIVLDRINGIDLDTIVEATNIINPILDEYDLISDEYILDISSKERG